MADEQDRPDPDMKIAVVAVLSPQEAALLVGRLEAEGIRAMVYEGHGAPGPWTALPSLPPLAPNVLQRGRPTCWWTNETSTGRGGSRPAISTGSGLPSLGPSDLVQTPGVGDTAQLLQTTVLEADPEPATRSLTVPEVSTSPGFEAIVLLPLSGPAGRGSGRCPSRHYGQSGRCGPSTRKASGGRPPAHGAVSNRVEVRGRYPKLASVLREFPASPEEGSLREDGSCLTRGIGDRILHRSPRHRSRRNCGGLLPHVEVIVQPSGAGPCDPNVHTFPRGAPHEEGTR